ncbi:MAG: hypothetical protein NZ739_04100 [Verrucomicrobiae bacterium]|nr:hypothetical protein [Verrucomicrobiae bacterium]MDW7980819.1 hypothetical protein [Verrucomicrobiales bacterium]
MNGAAPKRLGATGWILSAVCAFGQLSPGEPTAPDYLPGKSILSDPPAAEAINAKASYAGGWMNSAEGHNFDASISLPVSHAFGFQADGMYSRICGLDFYGGAGHLFWRNPDRGLLGIAGGYLYRTHVDTFQVGAEAEYYLGQFSLSAFAGIGRIEYSRPAPFIDTEPTRFVGSLRADWYPFEDLRVGAGFIAAFGNNLIKSDIEFQTPIAGLALTAEAAIGEHDYDHVLLGVRYYFGGNKTLQHRHRRLDPRSLMPQILHSLGLYGAEYNHKAKAYLARLFSAYGFDPTYGSSIVIGHYGVRDAIAMSESAQIIVPKFEQLPGLPQTGYPPSPPVEIPEGTHSTPGSSSVVFEFGCNTYRAQFIQAGHPPLPPSQISVDTGPLVMLGGFNQAGESILIYPGLPVWPGPGAITELQLPSP